MSAFHSDLWHLLETTLGHRRAEMLFETLDIDARLLTPTDASLPRAVLAEALNLVLFEQLLERVPEARLHVATERARGRKVCFDHGALRTLDLNHPSGLPRGHHAIARLLEPLGYAIADVYPLGRLGATGRAFCHLDLPEALSQFFVAELHVEGRSKAFQEAAGRLAASARNPLPAWAEALLDRLTTERTLALPEAQRLLPTLAACFARLHDLPTTEDFDTLHAESPETAWFATEGSVYNHATDRVPSVETTAQALRAAGAPMKERVESSPMGRVRQTASLSTPVQRPLRGADGQTRLRTVPGSFFELISRELKPDGFLDLSFDTGNATGIMLVTRTS